MNRDLAAKRGVLFVHGGGDNGYEADAPLAASLKQHLGPDYDVRDPEMKDTAAPDFGWPQKIAGEIDAMPGDIVLVGHSLGASMLLKYLSENTVTARVRGVFLLATPFWSGDEEWQRGLKLREDFATALPADVPIFLYHNQDDEEVDISHLAIYQEKLPRATVRKAATGGHQFNNDLAPVARDIRSFE